MKKIVLALGFLGVIGAISVGCGGPDNVGACKGYVETVNGLDCLGDIKIDESTCDAYANTTCDVSEYFNCLSDSYACKDGMLNQEKYAKIGDCAELAKCN